jgi:AcrR family transcriptional regulator
VKTLDGNALRTQRTRQRILEESLRLFNEQGEGNVTTGMIAAALGMSPGNLYYHFRNKEEIVERLFRQFAERMDVEPDIAADAPGVIEDLWLYLHLTLEAIWEFRFLYRNLDDLLARNRRLKASFNAIAERKLQGIVRLCQGMVQAGAMHASAEEIRTLARNVLVVATYWLNFASLRERRGASQDGLGQGAYQVMSLVGPYLVGEARRHFAALSRGYIEGVAPMR